MKALEMVFFTEWPFESQNILTKLPLEEKYNYSMFMSFLHQNKETTQYIARSKLIQYYYLSMKYSIYCHTYQTSTQHKHTTCGLKAELLGLKVLKTGKRLKYFPSDLCWKNILPGNRLRLGQQHYWFDSSCSTAELLQ